MLSDAEWDEQEERAERIAEVKKALSAALGRVGVKAFPWELEGDVLVTGSLRVIMEFCQENRSEIEELA